LKRGDFGFSCTFAAEWFGEAGRARLGGCGLFRLETGLLSVKLAI